MNYINKLKPDKNITGLFQPVIAIFLFLAIFLLFNLTWALFSLSIVYFLYTLLSIKFSTKTKNPNFLVPGTFQLLFAIYLLVLPEGLVPITRIEPRIFLAVAVLFMIFSAYLMFTKKLKWKGREIFELSAQNVSIKEGSFTGRPKPITKIDFSLQQIKEFSQFFQKNLFGLTYYSDKQIYFVPVKMGDEYKMLINSQSHILDKTWVSFAESGEIIVHISKKDYLEYKEDLSFNDLCDNMGNVFIDFIDSYFKNEQIRINDKIDSVSNSIFA